MIPPQQSTAAGRRASRPAPLTRKSTTAPPAKKSPLGKPASRPIKREEVAFESDDEDIAGLPSYCGLCEKQIVTPGQILYCSEQCRRKDQQKPILASPQTPARKPSYLSSDDHDIVPLRSPTIIRPPSMAFSDDSNSNDDSRPRSDSDAASSSYLSQYYSHSYDPRTRSSMPSLSHTPSSIMSTNSYMSTSRPLTRRSDPYSASFSSLSIDLVVPVVTGPSSCTSTSTIGEIDYRKQQFVGSSPSRSSLKTLFSHEAMKAPPNGKRAV